MQMVEAKAAMRLYDIPLESLAGYDVIAIDEGQFFPDVVEYSEEAANKGHVVIIAALDGDFRRKPFGRVLELIPMAERVDKLTAVCMTCFTDAAFTKRTVAATQIELIGGAEAYKPVCRACFHAGTEVVASKKPAVATRATSVESPGLEEEATGYQTPAAQRSRSMVSPSSDPVERVGLTEGGEGILKLEGFGDENVPIASEGH